MATSTTSVLITKSFTRGFLAGLEIQEESTFSWEEALDWVQKIQDTDYLVKALENVLTGEIKRFS